MLILDTENKIVAACPPGQSKGGQAITTTEGEPFLSATDPWPFVRLLGGNKERAAPRMRGCKRDSDSALAATTSSVLQRARARASNRFHTDGRAGVRERARDDRKRADQRG